VTRILLWSKRVGIGTIRVSHSHSPTNLRSCLIPWKAFLIPILRPCKIRTRTPCRFTLPKALMSPGCRTSASQPRRRGFRELFLLHLFRLIYLTHPNRPCQCTRLPALKPSEYPGFGCLRHTFVPSWISVSTRTQSNTHLSIVTSKCNLYRFV
jgi:hypothetical protein